MRSSNQSSSQEKKLRYLLLASSIAVFLLILLGGIVRVTESGGACIDWPTCFGQWTPPAGWMQIGEGASLDYFHRLATVLVTLLILAAAVKARRDSPGESWVNRPLVTAVGLIALQIATGGAVALRSADSGWKWISAVHLGLSLLILACLLIAMVFAFYKSAKTIRAGRAAFQSPFGHLSLVTLAAFSLLIVSGSVVTGGQFTTACTNWLLCDGSLLPGDMGGWVNLFHRLVVILVSGLVGILFIRAWRTQRTQTPILVATTAVGVLFFAQALLGAKLVDGYPAHLLGLHEVTAVAAWAAMVIQVVLVGLAARTRAEELAEAQAINRGSGLAKDLLMLTKPIVVALLLVTTYAGMVIGGEEWPNLPRTFWTLLGGFLAAGGSGAINQYIDRFDDIKMQRTKKRPIPAGRLTPGEGLAFGVGITLVSFFVMVTFVNFLAAILTLAGIIYYVLLYSIVLKKTTIHNIVIGGGAGAIPPLVGWAAATGSLNIPSIFLFAVVFMWTPPHFWALALVRRKDYARAGVPMLPVIRGEKETRWQIFIYTIELVALTMILPLFGLGGSIYLVGASLLGSWLLLAAWKVWKQGGNKLAWKMYRYSSMYLAFLFAVLVADALL